MTQLVEAKNGNITEEMKIISAKEGINITDLIENIAKGRVVIPCNKNRANLSPVGIEDKVWKMRFCVTVLFSLSWLTIHSFH